MPISAKLDEDYCTRYLQACKTEAKTAKRNRMDLNRDNFSMYQLEHNFSHKQAGQSKEVLSKVRNATEQIKGFFQQSLADLDDWWDITATDGTDGSSFKVTPDEAKKLTNFLINRADYFSHVGLSCQSGLLGSLSVAKVRGAMVSKPKFKTKTEGKGKSYKKTVVAIDDKTWELRFDVIRQEDYYPDPTGQGLYEIDECELDLHVVKQLAEGPDAIYDKSVTDLLQPWSGNAEMQEQKKADETGQNMPTRGMRPRVKISEFWGTIVDETNGDILAENVVMTVANEQHVIRKPTENPMWHQRTPIVAAALIEVANSVWGVALMDAGVKHSRSLTEIFNLILDSAMKAIWGINQIRVDLLEDPTQVTDGVRWGTNIKVGPATVPGQKVMEPVISGEIPTEVLAVFNLLNQEALTSMMTNDMRMGAQSTRAVKATEVVAAENSITSVFQGMSKNFEQKFIQPELELAWMTTAQNWDLIDKEIFVSLFGKERGEELANLEPQDVFVETINGYRFSVYGISLALRRQADFRKWTTFLQVIGASEPLIEAFLQQYTFEGLLGEIMTSLDINKAKIKSSGPQQGQPPQQDPAMQQPGGAPGAQPNMMSQTQAPPKQPMNALQQVFSEARPSSIGKRG